MEGPRDPAPLGRGPAYVLADCAGFLPACTLKPIDLPPARERRVTLRFVEPRRLEVNVLVGLRPGGEVRLRVIDASGTPVAAATVSPTSAGLPNRFPGMKTDSDGRVFFTCPLAGSYEFTATAGGRTARKTVEVSGSDLDVDLPLN